MINRATTGAPFRFQLDLTRGVPVYRQIIDQVMGAIASGGLRAGEQLPTVRQVAVDLAINPNTVARAYREMEIRGVVTTQQGTGTFITPQPVKSDEAERQRRLDALAADVAARAGREGFGLQELVERLKEILSEQDKRR